VKEAFPFKELIDAIIKGEAEKAVKIAELLISEGFSCESIIEKGLTEALRSLDSKCTNEEFNLLEIMLAGRAMVSVLNEVIAPLLPSNAPCSINKTIVLGTIKGDIHDLGKQVVRLLFSARGLRVIDLGKDVEPLDFVRIATNEGASYIGVSSLLTISIPFIREIKKILRREGYNNIKVIAGGAAIKQARPEDLDVDYIAKDPFDALHYIEKDIVE